MKLFVLKFGNHYLQGDLQSQIEEWVSNLGEASTYPEQWARKFAENALKNNQVVEVLEDKQALLLARQAASENVKRKWINAFLNSIGSLGGIVHVANDSKNHFAHEYYAANYTIVEAKEQFRKRFGLLA